MKKLIQTALTWLFSLAALALCGLLVFNLVLGTGSSSKASQMPPDQMGILDRMDMFMTNHISNALEGILSIDKVYWLNDDDMVAPKPDPAAYGSTADKAEMAAFLEKAKETMDLESTLFSPDLKFHINTEMHYYLDETIMAIVWKQVIDEAVYTFAEVKIAHPSQLRRFMAGGEYGSGKRFITTEMASSVNAVLASSGDFYDYRQLGIIVYDGVVCRFVDSRVDTCFVDDKGDLLLVKGGTLKTKEAAQAYVDENNIRFSISFGPILVQDGKQCQPKAYPLGQIDAANPRAALMQMGELHYVVITVNGESYDDNGEAWYFEVPDIHDFADRIASFKPIQAYTLDGGQTGVIALDGQLMNPVHYGYQRQISDIFYFATAIPDGE